MKKPQKPARRSMSPFGLAEPPPDMFAPLREALVGEQSPLFPLYQKVWDAPAHSAPDLDPLCQSLLQNQIVLEDKGAWPTVLEFMEKLLVHKTELFLVDLIEKEKDSYSVLFSKERDILMGHFFGPALESQPGAFSALVDRWMETDNTDRILHLLDFCAGSKNPTLDHFLLFSHPALNRILRDKALLRDYLEKTAPARSKLSTPAWEKSVRQALEI